jgi:hypothetical protein
MPSCTCFGVCGGVPKWKDPETGLYCTVCHGSGVYTTPPTALEEWEASQAMHAHSRANGFAPQPEPVAAVSPRPARVSRAPVRVDPNDERIAFVRSKAPTREQMAELRAASGLHDRRRRSNG